MIPAPAGGVQQTGRPKAVCRAAVTGTPGVADEFAHLGSVPFGPPVTGLLSGLVLRDSVPPGRAAGMTVLQRVRQAIPLRTPAEAPAQAASRRYQAEPA